MLRPRTVLLGCLLATSFLPFPASAGEPCEGDYPWLLDLRQGGVAVGEGEVGPRPGFESDWFSFRSDVQTGVILVTVTPVNGEVTLSVHSNFGPVGCVEDGCTAWANARVWACRASAASQYLEVRVASVDPPSSILSQVHYTLTASISP